MIILENLLLTQSGREKEDLWFQYGLTLCAGDLKTAERMISVKEIRESDATLPFDKYKWLLPIHGLWHLKLNYLLMITNVHKHPGANVDITSLQYAIDKWDRLGLMKRENFNDMEDLVIHSYDARIVGLLIGYILKSKKKHRAKHLDKVKDAVYIQQWITSRTKS